MRLIDKLSSFKDASTRWVANPHKKKFLIIFSLLLPVVFITSLFITPGSVFAINAGDQGQLCDYNGTGVCLQTDGIISHNLKDVNHDNKDNQFIEAVSDSVCKDINGNKTDHVQSTEHGDNQDCPFKNNKKLDSHEWRHRIVLLKFARLTVTDDKNKKRTGIDCIGLTGLNVVLRRCPGWGHDIGTEWVIGGNANNILINVYESTAATVFDLCSGQESYFAGPPVVDNFSPHYCGYQLYQH